MLTTLEERVAYLEGKVDEHSGVWQDLREQIRELSERIAHMEQRFDQRFAHMEQKFDQRFLQIDQRFAELDHRLSGRMDKLFFFILTTMVSSIGALIGVIVSLFVR